MSEISTTSDYVRFDRHTILNAEDLTLILALTSTSNPELENYLFGLFDGYLYDNLLDLAEEHLNAQENEALKKLVSKIKAE